MKNRDYPLAPTYFDGGSGEPPKKRKASSTPAHTKTTRLQPTPEQRGVLTRADKTVSAYHQAQAQTTDPSILNSYKKKAELAQDSAKQVYTSLKTITKVPAKKVSK